ncbi:MAG: hypothetical protein AB1696_28095 [Planctomycetota bacterium]
MTKRNILTRIVALEIIGFGGVVLFLWLNEVFDLPYHLFGAPQTVINFREAVFETALVVCLGAAVMLLTIRMVRRIKYLEGFLPVCSFCKKIRVGEEWIPLEDYLDAHTEAKLSHSYCSECVKKHYGPLIAGGKKAQERPDNRRIGGPGPQ